MPILPNSSKKSEEEGIHPNSFYEANITLRAKPEKHATKKIISGNIDTKKSSFKKKKQ